MQRPLPAMLLRHLTIIILIGQLTFGCSDTPAVGHAEQIDGSTHKDLIKKKHPSVDTTKIRVPSGYVQYVRQTDSMVVIKWGNDSFQNTSKPFENEILDERSGISWQTDKYVAIRRSCGSDCWYEIVLPYLSGRTEKFYYNPMAYDKENDIVICEHLFSDSDTVLLAENILTGQKQAVGKDWKKCSSAFGHYCVDSINILDRQLYLEWVHPNKIDRPNKKEIKHIKLDL